MQSDLAQNAIDAALAGNWEKAVEINSEIIKIDPSNVAALNRIARAYAEMGNLNKARIASQKVLKIDKLNPIAIRCITKWKSFKKTNEKGVHLKVSANVFIEEPSRTKIVSLVNLGDAMNLIGLDCGDPLRFTVHPHRLSIITNDDKYVGRFPDDLAHKFIKLMKLGNSYEVVVKSADSKHIKIIIRATSKSVL